MKYSLNLKNLPLYACLLSAFTLTSNAANTFIVTGFENHSNGSTMDGTATLPMFTTPNALPQETVDIVSASSTGRINFDLQKSNVGPALSASFDPGAYLEYTITGGGSVTIKTTEITAASNSFNPYRFEMITTGNVESIVWKVGFNSTFSPLDNSTAAHYTIAQRTTVDANLDGTAQNFATALRAYDETLTQYDLSTFANLETPFINPVPTDPGTGTFAVISHTDPNYAQLSNEFLLNGTSTNGVGRTLTEQVLLNGWASTGNGIKSLDSTDRQANQFGAFEGSITSHDGSLEEGTVFALTFNGTITDSATSIIPEPTSATLITMSLASLLLIRKRS